MNFNIDDLHVVFRVGGADYVMPASIVLQLESFTGATAVPGAAAHIAGLVQIRGRVIPVIDLRKTFGMPEVEQALEHRVIVVDHGGRCVGLLVDTAREVVKLPPESFTPPPALVFDQSRGYVKAVAKLQDRLVMLLDPGLLISQENENVEQR